MAPVNGTVGLRNTRRIFITLLGPLRNAYTQFPEHHIEACDVTKKPFGVAGSPQQMITAHTKPATHVKLRCPESRSPSPSPG